MLPTDPISPSETGDSLENSLHEKAEIAGEQTKVPSNDWSNVVSPLDQMFNLFPEELA